MRSTQVRSRIASKTAVVTVVGQGYVGLSVAAGAAVAGMTVHAVDVDEVRVASLRDGRNVVPGVDERLFAEAVDTGRLTFGTDPKVAAVSDVVLICVPTPGGRASSRPLVHREQLGVRSRRTCGADTLVVLESTTYPARPSQVLRPLARGAGGLTAGRTSLLAYSPERIDPGNPKYGLRNTPRVVGGHHAPSHRGAAAFYGAGGR